MEHYQVRSEKLSGTNYKEIYKKAIGAYREIVRKTKRHAYIRSAYFEKEKIFLGLFWQHLEDRLNHNDKVRRLKYFSCGLELIRASKREPKSMKNPHKSSEMLYRFTGITKNKEVFHVQIKEDSRSGEKFLTSIFPV